MSCGLGRLIITALMIISQPCVGTGTITKVANELPTSTRSHDYVQIEATNEILRDSPSHDESIKHATALQTPQRKAAEAEDFGGVEECPCINATKILSTITDCVTNDGSPGVSAFGGCYSLDFGTTCAAHDMTNDYRCMAGDSANSTSGIPSYCYDQFCYVDYNKCKSSKEFYYRSSFETFANENLFYSYSTCGSGAEGWLDYEATSRLEQVSLHVTIPRMSFPAHFKYTEEGAIATDESYYYNDSIPWAGSIIDYLNAVAEISNMDKVQFTSRSVSGDRAHPESSFTASVHDVSAGISDAGGATFWITSQRLSMTTFSTPIGVDRIHFFVQQPEERGTLLEGAEKIAMPFSLSLWVILFSVLLITASLMVYLDRNEGDDGIWNDKTAGPYWNKSSLQRRLGIVCKYSLDSFILHASHMLGQHVEFDPFMSLAQKILYFGFALVVFIAVAAYTANLAAFLTLSSNANYFVSNMKEAIATNTPVCVNPVLAEDYEAAWPGGLFVYNRTAEASGMESVMAMMDMFDAGICKAIGYQLETGVLPNEQIMQEFCKRNLVPTGSFLLEKPLAFPVRSHFAAGLSHWLHEADEQGISYQAFLEKWLPAPLCNLEVDHSVQALPSLTPANLILPIVVWLCCIIVAFVMNALRMRQKSIRQEKWKTRSKLDNASLNALGNSTVSDVIQQQQAEFMSKLTEITRRERRTKETAILKENVPAENNVDSRAKDFDCVAKSEPVKDEDDACG